MSNPTGSGGIVTAVVEIIRKDTGKKEVHTLTGFVPAEKKGKE